MIAAFMALGWFVRLHDVATMHHLASAMPATLADAGELTGPQVDTVVSQIEAKVSTDYARFKNLHVALYTTGNSRVFAMVGEVPSGGQRHTDEFFQGLADGAGSAAQPLHSVPAGPKGGGLKCGSLTAGGTVCAWVDNGTTGAVAANTDESGTLVYINALRVAMER